MCDRVKLELAAIHEHQDLLQELFVDIVITTNRDSNILGLDEALLAGEVHLVPNSRILRCLAGVWKDR